MHVGLHCYEYPPCNQGGVGTFCKDLAEALVSEGVKVTVIGFYFDNVLTLDRVKDEIINGVRVIRIPQLKTYRLNQVNMLLARYKLYKLIKKLHQECKFDCIESPEASGWFPFGTPSNIPLVTRLHAGQAFFQNQFKGNRSRLTMLLEKQQIGRSQKIVGVSKYVVDVTFKLFKLDRNYQVIYNCLSTDKFVSVKASNSEKVVLFFGTIAPKKGVEELIKSMNYFLELHEDYKLVLAGKNTLFVSDEPYELILRRFLSEKHQSKVEFTGALNRESELIPLIKSAKVCCFPSHVESFGLAPLEAMALGKAVVNTKLTSGPEVVEDNVTGLLCDPTDPSDIASKLSLLIQNDELRRTLSFNAFNSVRTKFSYRKWVDANLSLYKSTMEND